MADISGGELLMECLVNQGINVIFGIPDGTFNNMFQWTHEHGEAKNLRFVTMRHEAAGAHMADAMARVTGKPGVVISGAGPGVANMIAGVATAFAENIPMIALTSSRRTDLISPPRGGMQVLDQVAAINPLSKMSAQVTRPERIPEVFGLAFRTATTGMPGPAHIDIPEDIMYARIPAESAPPTPPVALSLPGADEEMVAKAAEMLVNAKEPFIHCGATVVRAEAWEELVELAEHLGIPVTTTPAGRGALPEDHPLCIPTIATTCRAALSQADVVLAVGVRFGELDFFGRAPLWGTPETQKLIQIHIAPEHIGVNKKVDIPLIGHAKIALKQLLEAVKKLSKKRDEHPKMQQYRDLIAMTERELLKKHCTGSAPVVTGEMIKEAREFFPREAITVLDGGNTSLWNVHFNKILAPRTMLWTSDFGHLGTGLPYAIGAKLAAPDTPVYLISGDSAFGFNIQELETARRNNANIIALVAVDNAWGMEKSSQGRIFGTHDYYVNCEHSPARYDKIAEAFGCFGACVEKPEEVKPALQKAADSGLPAVIHVAVDAQANVFPPGIELWAATHSTK